MMLPSSLIIEYLNSKFPNSKLFGAEFTTNSIFTHDEKMHLSVNTESGLWQDFKAHETGNFAQLVAAVEDIPYDAALKFLRSKLFDSPEHLFEISSLRVENQKPVKTNSIKELFQNFKAFDPKQIDADNLTDRLAQKFITSRKLTRFDFYICRSGRYANRLIIPYAYDDSDPFYFQARNLSLMGIKYLNPSKEFTGVKASDILFPYKDDADYIFITEGPLDAISLQLNGLNATCTQGSKLSHAQAEQLRDKQVIFAYDNDEAGWKGILDAKQMFLNKNKNEFCIARLPLGIKDWNDLHVRAKSKKEFKGWLVNGLKDFDFEFEVTEALD